MNLLGAFEPQDDSLTPAQRALLDAIAQLTEGHAGCWADQLAIHSWTKRTHGLWTAGGSVAASLRRRGLIEVADVAYRPTARRTGAWNRTGQLYRLTEEGAIEQYAGAE